MKKVILATLALAAMAFGADVTGKWTAEMPGRGGQTRTTTMNLKQSGSSLTGTVSGMGGDTEISEGKVNGDKISFAVVREFNGNTMKMLYEGTLAGDELKLKVGREGGDRMNEVTAKRAN
ncbi:hypothetical protein F183_A44690 [Bryobacterales bacterium F-183]|nr:hypothetical protein F183_A44690 [Bryobacterales bacterium F-183]